MTTLQTFRNKAIVIGRLGTVLNRKRKETLLDPYRTPIGGQEYRAAVQLITTEGEPYMLGLELHPGIPGYDLFDGADATTCLAFEGAVRLFTRYDSRYAEGDDDAGRRVTEMRLDVRLIRAPRDDEPDGATAVWLEGTVVEPPRFARHYEQTSLQVGITTLRVMLDQASDERPTYPGLRRDSQTALEVHVAVRTSDELAGLLYRPGNQVRIDGELSRWMLPQFGDSVQSTIAKRYAEHQATVARAANREEQNALVRQYRREVQNLSLQARTLVLVSYVEATSPTSIPASYDEAQDLRRAYVKKRRAQRMAKEQAAAKRQEQAAANRPDHQAQRSMTNAAQRSAANTPETVTSDRPTEEAARAAPALPRPPRRRPSVISGVASPEAITTEEGEQQVQPLVTTPVADPPTSVADVPTLVATSVADVPTLLADVPTLVATPVVDGVDGEEA